MQKRHERLTKRLTDLNNQLTNALDVGNDLGITETLELIRTVEKQLFKEKTISKVEQINKREATKKAILKDWLEVEHFTSDLLTDDMRPHKTKVKKFPKLLAFMNKYKYTYFKIGYDGIIEMYTDGNEYRRHYTEGSGDTRKIYLLTDLDLKECCTRNQIQFEDRSPKKVLSNILKAKKETAKLKDLIEKSQSKIKGFDGNYLKNEGFVNTYNEHLYLIH